MEFSIPTGARCPLLDGGPLPRAQADNVGPPRRVSDPGPISRRRRWVWGPGKEGSEIRTPSPPIVTTPARVYSSTEARAALFTLATNYIWPSDNEGPILPANPPNINLLTGGDWKDNHRLGCGQITSKWTPHPIWYDVNQSLPTAYLPSLPCLGPDCPDSVHHLRFFSRPDR